MQVRPVTSKQLNLVPRKDSFLKCGGRLTGDLSHYVIFN
jgi:hypothetical protein